MPGNGVAGWRDFTGRRFMDPRTRGGRHAIVPGGARRKAGVPGFGPALGVSEADAVRAASSSG